MTTVLGRMCVYKYLLKDVKRVTKRSHLERRKYLDFTTAGESGYGGLFCIQLAQDGVHWRRVLNTVTNFYVP
jgi:hypothetical protein